MDAPVVDYMHYKVEILLPKHWDNNVVYRFLQDYPVDGETVPAGFETDGATIPRLFWGVFPPVCQYFPAAAVHDLQLQSGAGRYLAWRAFKSALQACGIPNWRKYIMVWFVRGYDFYAVYVKGEKA